MTSCRYVRLISRSVANFDPGGIPIAKCRQFRSTAICSGYMSRNITLVRE